jgi:hypothetical protein
MTQEEEIMLPLKQVRRLKEKQVKVDLALEAFIKDGCLPMGVKLQGQEREGLPIPMGTELVCPLIIKKNLAKPSL